MTNVSVSIGAAGTVGSGEGTRRVGGERDPLGLDLVQGLGDWRLWTMLGWQDIRQRYRRSVIGPFWITLSMGILIALLGVIYSRIFHVDIRVYLPFFAAGYIIWGFISTCFNECCAAFQDSERVIKQVKWPFSVYVLRVMWRNSIIFLHTIVLMIPIALIFRLTPQIETLLILPGFLLLYANLVWIGLTLAILSSRFRDVVQIVQTIVTIMMFGTPILWPVSTLGDLTWVANVNPVFHFIEIVRAPMLGEAPALLSWAYASATIIVGSLCAILLFRRVSRRIVYWL